eukprot:541076-Amorphochlora_amoeboformis.AAC.1
MWAHGLHSPKESAQGLIEAKRDVGSRVCYDPKKSYTEHMFHDQKAYVSHVYPGFVDCKRLSYTNIYTRQWGYTALAAILSVAICNTYGWALDTRADARGHINITFAVARSIVMYMSSSLIAAAQCNV